VLPENYTPAAIFSRKSLTRISDATVKLVVSGDVDEALLDALQDYVKRQKKRLGVSHSKATADKDEAAN
jgi:hypothetical protein